MAAIYEHKLVVAPTEIDRLGHASNLAYLAWMQAAALAHSAEQGWPPERYEQLGAGWVVRSHEIKYLQSAYVDQDIVVRTWVSGMKRVGSTRSYKIVRAGDGGLLARAQTQWAFVDFATLGLCKIPDEVWRAFELVDD